MSKRQGETLRDFWVPVPPKSRPPAAAQDQNRKDPAQGGGSTDPAIVLGAQPASIDSPAAAHDENRTPSTSAQLSASSLSQTSLLKSGSLSRVSGGGDGVDIADYVGKSLTRKQTVELIQNLWRPSRGYKFPERPPPSSTGKRYGTINIRHFDKFDWLAWSDRLKGCFCLPCAIFAITAEGGRGGGQKALVKLPLTTFTKLTGKDGKLTEHEARHYHALAVDSMDRFLKNPEQGIDFYFRNSGN